MKFGGLVIILLLFALQSFAELDDSTYYTDHLKDEGYKRECEKTTNSASEFEACAKKFMELQNRDRAEKARIAAEKKAAAENASPMDRDDDDTPDPEICEAEEVLKQCHDAYTRAQDNFIKKNINLCRANCALKAPWIQSRIGGCSAMTVSKRMSRPMAEQYARCNIPAAAASEDKQEKMNDYAGKGTFDDLWAKHLSGDSDVSVYTRTEKDGDNYHTETTCLGSKSNRFQPQVCRVTSGIGAGSAGYPSYKYGDMTGQLYSTPQQASTANNNYHSFFTSGVREKPGVMDSSLFSFDGNKGGIADESGATTGTYLGLSDSEKALLGAGGGKAPIPADPIVRKAPPVYSGGATTNSSGATTSTSTSSTDPLQQSSNQSNGSTSGGSSNGGSTSGGSTSGGSVGGGFGDPSMFPNQQSAKSSPSAEVTASSADANGRTLGYASGSPSGSSSSGSYKSYAGGNPSMKSGEVAVGSANNLGYAQSVGGSLSPSSAGRSGNVGSFTPSFSAGGLQIASINQNKVQPNIRIGDQGYYKPGGAGTFAPGGSKGSRVAALGNGKKGSGKLKSIGGCAPGNLQCVLAKIGGPGAKLRSDDSGGTNRGIASVGSGTVKSVGYRGGLGVKVKLPAGVTGGIEPIFRRLEVFHNGTLTLDEDGLLNPEEDAISPK
jgi:hypothetical protein